MVMAFAEDVAICEQIIYSISYLTYQLLKRSRSSVPCVTSGKSIRSYPKDYI